MSVTSAIKCLFSMRQAASGGGSRAQRDKEFFPASEVAKAKSDMRHASLQRVFFGYGVCEARLPVADGVWWGEVAKAKCLAR